MLLYFPKNGGGGSGMFLYGPGYRNSFGGGGVAEHELVEAVVLVVVAQVDNKNNHLLKDFL